MANFSALKQAIQNNIKQNGNKEITGNLLQTILLSMVTTMGDGAINDLDGEVATSVQFIDGKIVFKNAANTVVYQLDTNTFLNDIETRIDAGAVFAGYATPSTTPAALTGQKVFYVATQAGTYTHFHFNGGNDGITLAKDGVYFIESGLDADDWNATTIMQLDDVPTPSSNNAVKSGGVAEELALGAVYDVSAKNPTAGPNNDGKWESLSALLSDANLNTLIPTAYRKGGMSIKFVHSVDNNYVQFRLKTNTFSTTPTDWQNEDVSVYSTWNDRNIDVQSNIYQRRWINSQNKWMDGTGNYRGIVIPVYEGQRIEIKGNATEAIPFAYIVSVGEIGTTVNFKQGTAKGSITANAELTINVDNSFHYLWYGLGTFSDPDVLPQKFVIIGEKGVLDLIDALKSSVNTINGNISDIQGSIGDINGNITGINDDILNINTSLSGAEDNIEELQTIVKGSPAKVIDLTSSEYLRGWVTNQKVWQQESLDTQIRKGLVIPVLPDDKVRIVGNATNNSRVGYINNETMPAYGTTLAMPANPANIDVGRDFTIDLSTTQNDVHFLWFGLDLYGDDITPQSVTILSRQGEIDNIHDEIDNINERISEIDGRQKGLIYNNDCGTTDDFIACIRNSASSYTDDSTNIAIVSDGITIPIGTNKFTYVDKLIRVNPKTWIIDFIPNGATALSLFCYGLDGGGNGISDTTPLLKCDFANNSFICGYNNNSISYTFASGTKYRVKIVHRDWNFKASIINLVSGIESNIVEFYPDTLGNRGLIYDVIALSCEGSVSPIICKYSVVAKAKQPFLGIFGDSITVGFYGTNVEGVVANKYAELIGDYTNREFFTSGRGGGSFATMYGGADPYVAGKTFEGFLYNELPVLLPTYAMLTLGTNGGGTYNNYKQFVEYCLAHNITPIVNMLPIRGDTEGHVNRQTVITANNNIKQIWKDYGIHGARFDLATSLNNDGITEDTSLYESDYVHPNALGHKAMADRAKIDCPELFD